jgi:hemolysin III
MIEQFHKMRENIRERVNFEERVNVITHSPGVLLGVLLYTMLLAKANTEGIELHIAYFTYSLSFISVYMASTLYHAAKDISNKRLLKRIDHACIYLFMAGCYTPFVVLNMDETSKYWFLALIWTIAAIGIFYKFNSNYKGSKLSLLLYFSFAFMCFFNWDNFLSKIPSDSFWLLVFGGAAYVIGVGFYMAKRIPYHHGIWHVFVLIGSLLHFYALYIN